MNEAPGKGFARRVTRSNLQQFLYLLGDRNAGGMQNVSGQTNSAISSAHPDIDELAVPNDLFGGSKIRVNLPFKSPTRRYGNTSGVPNVSDVAGTTQGANVPQVPQEIQALVSEIPGPGRWSQAAFTQDIFNDYFGGGAIDLAHINSDGTATYRVVNPIVKGSSNYCYELDAARGLQYQSASPGRPIGVFFRELDGRFQYRLVMPDDPVHLLLDALLTVEWQGSAGRMRRVTIGLDKLVRAWPSVPFP